MQTAEEAMCAFPDDWEKITALRETHSALDEICTDFERLILDVSQAGAGQRQMSDALRNDYLASLAGLKHEILEWMSEHLAAASERTSK